MAAPQVVDGYRLQLTATFLTIRVGVGGASLIALAFIVAFGSVPNAWILLVAIFLDVVLNVVEWRRSESRAAVSLASLATLLGLLFVLLREPVFIGAGLVFMIVAATALADRRTAIWMTTYSAVWAGFGIYALAQWGLPYSDEEPSVLAVSLSIAAFTATTIAFLYPLTRRLDRYDALRNRLISSVSHELRTPLTGLHGLATVLHDNFDDLSPSEVAEFLDLLVLESAEATALVEDLLTAVRPTDFVRIDVAPIDIAVEVDTVLAMLGPAMSKDVDVQDGDGSRAIADPIRFRQIIRNLLTNADRYGGQTIRIRIESAGNLISVTVSDDGPGIPLEDRGKVFEEWQASDLGVRHPQSLGLGLTISRRLARAMEGNLTYEYAGGESRFTLTLPAAPAVTGAAALI